jgi:hypothetical protein
MVVSSTYRQNQYYLQPAHAPFNRGSVVLRKSHAAFLRFYCIKRLTQLLTLRSIISVIIIIIIIIIIINTSSSLYSYL